MALGTVVRDIYTDSTRSSMHKTIDELRGTADWHTAGLYCYWDPATQEALYIGLSKDLAVRFAQHNGLKGNKPNNGNKGEKINGWFKTHDRLGFSLVIQDASADDVESRYSEIAEGQLIEGYRALHGKFPLWNRIGGSKEGAGYADTDTATWFDFMTGKTDGMVVARRTITELNDDYDADVNEAAIHMSRTGLNLRAVNGKLDDKMIVAGMREHMARTVRPFPANASQYDFDKLHAYLEEPAPHPELSSKLAE